MAALVDPALIVLCGPPASGKTALALALAERFSGEIVSCDSVAVYRGMEIGTAKPTPAERARVPHHLIDILTPDQPCTAGDYSRLARAHGYVLELYADRTYAVESDAPAARAHASLLGLPFAPTPLESLGAPIVRCQWLASVATATEILAEPEDGLEVLASTSPVMPETVFINMTARGVTKATAIRTIASAIDVPLGEIMFVGDGMNDLAGMQAVGFPVAMGNAEPDVRAAARAVVGHVDDGGLAQALDLAITSRAT